MFKLLSSVIFVLALFSNNASSESPSRIIQSWSKLELPMYGNLITPVTPISSRYHTIRVAGKLRGSDKFHVNLLSGNDYTSDDAPLHLRIDTANKKFMSNVNLYTGNTRSWGKEIYSDNPLKANDEFNIEIIIKHTHFDILLNGQIIERRLHSLPASSISYVHVYCDAGASVNLQSVSREYPVYEPSQL